MTQLRILVLGAFWICASSFASGTDVSNTLIESLVRSMEWHHLLGYYRTSDNLADEVDAPTRVEQVRTLTRILINAAQENLDFSCRHPAVAHYLTYHYPIAFHLRDCGPRSVLDHELNQITLDPTRLYRIDYVVAGRGETLASRFGHSMLRLVFCAPERAQIDEQCLEDRSSHLMVGFAAQTEDTIFNYAGAISGQYPSAMSLYYAEDVIARYNQRELRDVLAYPLSLSAHQKAFLLKIVAERYWSYRGSYRFLSNNCSTEIRAILRAIVSAPHPLHRPALGTLTPLALRKVLFDSNLIQGEAVRFTSRRRALHAILREISGPRSLHTAPLTLHVYTNTPARVRREWIQHSLDNHEWVARYLLLEETTMWDLAKKFEKNSLSVLRESPCGNEQMLRQLNSALHDLRPDRLKNRSYFGVPETQDIVLESVRRERQNRFTNQVRSIQSCLVTIPQLQQLKQELDETAQTVGLLKRRL